MLETLALVRWDSDWPLLLATFILSYLLGSIPFGLIFGWLAGAGDIRKIGSGNIGATNVLRAGKRWAAAATLIGDGGKAVVAVLVAQTYFGLAPFPVIAGFGAFVGHIFPFGCVSGAEKGLPVSSASHWRSTGPLVFSPVPVGWLRHARFGFRHLLHLSQQP